MIVGELCLKIRGLRAAVHSNLHSQLPLFHIILFAKKCQFCVSTDVLTCTLIEEDCFIMFFLGSITSRHPGKMRSVSGVDKQQSQTCSNSRKRPISSLRNAASGPVGARRGGCVRRLADIELNVFSAIIRSCKRKETLFKFRPVADYFRLLETTTT